ncbi:hypothetical protein BESB_013990 [Besnoitia besnoiti]|uniref:Uncharacterized protein n=1 Tax=Besnoitia besnoiti TaxID=94643 RepID=A0A2A9MAY2_BESBE|nr:hypothetical protein BESB_013990 [Besnoitia besnoiti]PFH32787.1 hypothetical protein BESB_013990 [Besnoitia besnoiti]
MEEPRFHASAVEAVEGRGRAGRRAEGDGRAQPAESPRPAHVGGAERRSHRKEEAELVHLDGEAAQSGDTVEDFPVNATHEGERAEDGEAAAATAEVPVGGDLGVLPAPDDEAFNDFNVEAFPPTPRAGEAEHADAQAPAACDSAPLRRRDPSGADALRERKSPARHVGGSADERRQVTHEVDPRKRSVTVPETVEDATETAWAADATPTARPLAAAVESRESRPTERPEFCIETSESESLASVLADTQRHSSASAPAPGEAQRSPLAEACQEGLAESVPAGSAARVPSLDSPASSLASEPLFPDSCRCPPFAFLKPFHAPRSPSGASGASYVSSPSCWARPAFAASSPALPTPAPARRASLSSSSSSPSRLGSPVSSSDSSSASSPRRRDSPRTRPCSAAARLSRVSPDLCPFLLEHEGARVTAVLLNCLSLAQFELARAILRQLVSTDPRHAVALTATLVLHGPPPSWLCSPSVPSSAHLAWLCAHELLAACERQRRTPAFPHDRRGPPSRRPLSQSARRFQASVSAPLPSAAVSAAARAALGPQAALPANRLPFCPAFPLPLLAIFPAWLLRRLHMDLLLAQALLDSAAHGTPVFSAEVATELRTLHAVLLGIPLEVAEQGDAREAGGAVGARAGGVQQLEAQSERPGEWRVSEVGRGLSACERAARGPREQLEGVEANRGAGEIPQEQTSLPSREGRRPADGSRPPPVRNVDEGAREGERQGAGTRFHPTPSGVSSSSASGAQSPFSCECPEIIHLPSLLLLPLPHTLPASLSRLPGCVVPRKARLASYLQGTALLSLEAVKQLSSFLKSHPAAAAALFEALGYAPATGWGLEVGTGRVPLTPLSPHAVRGCEASQARGRASSSIAPPAAQTARREGPPPRDLEARGLEAEDEEGLRQRAAWACKLAVASVRWEGCRGSGEARFLVDMSFLLRVFSSHADAAFLRVAYSVPRVLTPLYNPASLFRSFTNLRRSRESAVPSLALSAAPPRADDLPPEACEEDEWVIAESDAPPSPSSPRPRLDCGVSASSRPLAFFLSFRSGGTASFQSEPGTCVPVSSLKALRPATVEALTGAVRLQVVRRLQALHIGVASESLLRMRREREPFFASLGGVSDRNSLQLASRLRPPVDQPCLFSGLESLCALAPGDRALGLASRRRRLRQRFVADAYCHLRFLDPSAGLLALLSSLLQPQLQQSYAAAVAQALCAIRELWQRARRPGTDGRGRTRDPAAEAGDDSEREAREPHGLQSPAPKALRAASVEGAAASGSGAGKTGLRPAEAKGGGARGDAAVGTGMRAQGDAPPDDDVQKEKSCTLCAAADCPLQMVTVVDRLGPVRRELLREGRSALFLLISLFVAFHDDADAAALLLPALRRFLAELATQATASPVVLAGPLAPAEAAPAPGGRGSTLAQSPSPSPPSASLPSSSSASGASAACSPRQAAAAGSFSSVSASASRPEEGGEAAGREDSALEQAWAGRGVLEKCVWLDLKEGRRCLERIFEASLVPLLQAAGNEFLSNSRSRASAPSSSAFPLAWTGPHRAAAGGLGSLRSGAGGDSHVDGQRLVVSSRCASALQRTAGFVGSVSSPVSETGFGDGNAALGDGRRAAAARRDGLEAVDANDGDVSRHHKPASATASRFFSKFLNQLTSASTAGEGAAARDGGGRVSPALMAEQSQRRMSVDARGREGAEQEGSDPPHGARRPARDAHKSETISSPRTSVSRERRPAEELPARPGSLALLRAECRPSEVSQDARPYPRASPPGQETREETRRRGGASRRRLTQGAEGGTEEAGLQCASSPRTKDAREKEERGGGERPRQRPPSKQTRQSVGHSPSWAPDSRALSRARESSPEAEAPHPSTASRLQRVGNDGEDAEEAQEEANRGRRHALCRDSAHDQEDSDTEEGAESRGAAPSEAEARGRERGGRGRARLRAESQEEEVKEAYRAGSHLTPQEAREGACENNLRRRKKLWDDSRIGVYGECPSRSVLSRLPVYEAFLSHAPLTASEPLVAPPVPSLALARGLFGGDAREGTAERSAFASASLLAPSPPVSTEPECSPAEPAAAPVASQFAARAPGENFLTLQLYGHLDDHWVRLKMAHLALPPAFDLISFSAVSTGAADCVESPRVREARRAYFQRAASLRSAGSPPASSPAASCGFFEDSSHTPHSLPRGQRGRGDPRPPRGLEAGRGGAGLGAAAGGAEADSDRALACMNLDEASAVAAEDEMAFSKAAGIPLPAFWDSYYACLRVAQEHCVEFPLRKAVELVLQRQFALASRLLAPFPQLRALVALLCWGAFAGQMRSRQRLLDSVWRGFDDKNGGRASPAEPADLADGLTPRSCRDAPPRPCERATRAQGRGAGGSLDWKETAAPGLRPRDGDIIVQQHVQVLDYKTRASWWLAALLLSHGAESESASPSRLSSLPGPQTAAAEASPVVLSSERSALFRRLSARQAECAARRLREVARRSHRPGTPFSFASRGERATAEALGDSPQGPRDGGDCCETASKQRGAGRGAAETLEGEGAREGDADSSASRAPAASAAPVGAGRDEEGSDRLVLDEMEPEDRLAALAAEVFDELQTHSALFVLRARGCLPRISPSTFFAGLSKLPPTARRATTAEREHDADVAYLYFALRAAIHLVEASSAAPAAFAPLVLPAPQLPGWPRLRSRQRLPVPGGPADAGAAWARGKEREGGVQLRSRERATHQKHLAGTADDAFERDPRLGPGRRASALSARQRQADGGAYAAKRGRSSSRGEREAAASAEQTGSLREDAESGRSWKGKAHPWETCERHDEEEASGASCADRRKGARPRTVSKHRADLQATADSTEARMQPPEAAHASVPFASVEPSAAQTGRWVWGRFARPGDNADLAVAARKAGRQADVFLLLDSEAPRHSRRELSPLQADSVAYVSASPAQAAGALKSPEAKKAERAGEVASYAEAGKLPAPAGSQASAQRLEALLPHLSDLIGAVRRPSYRVALLLHLCSLCFTAVADGGLSQTPEEIRDARAMERRRFIVPPNVLLSLVMLIRAHLEQLSEEVVGEAEWEGEYGRSDEDREESTGEEKEDWKEERFAGSRREAASRGQRPAGCRGEARQKAEGEKHSGEERAHNGVLLFIRALDCFTQELLWRGQLCLEQFFDGVALSAAPHAGSAWPHTTAEPGGDSRPRVAESLGSPSPSLARSPLPIFLVDASAPRFAARARQRGERQRRPCEEGQSPRGAAALTPNQDASSSGGPSLAARSSSSDTEPRAPRSGRPRALASVVLMPQWLQRCREIGAVPTLPAAAFQSTAGAALLDSGSDAEGVGGRGRESGGERRRDAAAEAARAPGDAGGRTRLQLARRSEGTTGSPSRAGRRLSPAASDGSQVTSRSLGQTRVGKALKRFTTPVAGQRNGEGRLSLRANAFSFHLLSSPSLLVARTLQLNDFAFCARLLRYFDLPQSLNATVAVARAFAELRRALGREAALEKSPAKRARAAGALLESAPAEIQVAAEEAVIAMTRAFPAASSLAPVAAWPLALARGASSAGAAGPLGAAAVSFSAALVDWAFLLLIQWPQLLALYAHVDAAVSCAASPPACALLLRRALDALEGSSPLAPIGERRAGEGAEGEAEPAAALEGGNASLPSALSSFFKTFVDRLSVLLEARNPMPTSWRPLAGLLLDVEALPTEPALLRSHLYSLQKQKTAVASLVETLQFIKEGKRALRSMHAARLYLATAVTILSSELGIKSRKPDASLAGDGKALATGGACSGDSARDPRHSDAGATNVSLAAPSDSAAVSSASGAGAEAEPGVRRTHGAGEEKEATLSSQQLTAVGDVASADAPAGDAAEPGGRASAQYLLHFLQYLSRIVELTEAATHKFQKKSSAAQSSKGTSNACACCGLTDGCFYTAWGSPPPPSACPVGSADPGPLRALADAEAAASPASMPLSGEPATSGAAARGSLAVGGPSRAPTFDLFAVLFSRPEATIARVLFELRGRAEAQKLAGLMDVDLVSVLIQAATPLQLFLLRGFEATGRADARRGEADSAPEVPAERCRTLQAERSLQAGPGDVSSVPSLGGRSGSAPASATQGFASSRAWRAGGSPPAALGASPYVLSMRTGLLLAQLEQPLKNARARDTCLLAALACLERLPERWPSRSFYQASLALIGDDLRPLQRWIEERIWYWEALRQGAGPGAGAQACTREADCLACDGAEESERATQNGDARLPEPEAAADSATAAATRERREGRGESEVEADLLSRIETQGWTPDQLAALPPHLRGLLLAVADDLEVSTEACARRQATGLMRRGELQSALRLIDRTLPGGSPLQRRILRRLLRSHMRSAKHSPASSPAGASGLLERPPAPAAEAERAFEGGERSAPDVQLAAADPAGSTHAGTGGRVSRSPEEAQGDSCGDDLPLPGCIAREEDALRATEAALALYRLWDVRTVQETLTCCLRRLRAEAHAAAATCAEEDADTETSSDAERDSTCTTSSAEEEEEDLREEGEGTAAKTSLKRRVPPATAPVSHAPQAEATCEERSEQEASEDGQRPRDAQSWACCEVSSLLPSTGEPSDSSLALDRETTPREKPTRRERREGLIARVEQVLTQVKTFSRAVELCGEIWTVWHGVEAACQTAEGVSEVVHVLLSHNGHELAREITELYTPAAAALLPTVHLSHLLHLFTVCDDKTNAVKALLANAPRDAVALGFQMLPRSHKISDRLLLCSVMLSPPLGAALTAAERARVSTLSASLQLLETVSACVEPPHEDLLLHPHLLAESLLMNARSDVLAPFFQRWPELRDDDLILQYARKALCLPHAARVSASPAAALPSASLPSRTARELRLPHGIGGRWSLTGDASQDACIRRMHAFGVFPSLDIALQLLHLCLPSSVRNAEACLRICDDLSLRLYASVPVHPVAAHQSPACFLSSSPLLASLPGAPPSGVSASSPSLDTPRSALPAPAELPHASPPAAAPLATLAGGCAADAKSSSAPHQLVFVPAPLEPPGGQTLNPAGARRAPSAPTKRLQGTKGGQAAAASLALVAQPPRANTAGVSPHALSPFNCFGAVHPSRSTFKAVQAITSRAGSVRYVSCLPLRLLLPSRAEALHATPALSESDDACDRWGVGRQPRLLATGSRFAPSVASGGDGRGEVAGRAASPDTAFQSSAWWLSPSSSSSGSSCWSTSPSALSAQPLVCMILQLLHFCRAHFAASVPGVSAAVLLGQELLPFLVHLRERTGRRYSLLSLMALDEGKHLRDSLIRADHLALAADLCGCYQRAAENLRDTALAEALATLRVQHDRLAPAGKDGRRARRQDPVRERGGGEATRRDASPAGERGGEGAEARGSATQRQGRHREASADRHSRVSSYYYSPSRVLRRDEEAPRPPGLASAGSRGNITSCREKGEADAESYASLQIGALRSLAPLPLSAASSPQDVYASGAHAVGCRVGDAPSSILTALSANPNVVLRAYPVGEVKTVTLLRMGDYEKAGREMEEALAVNQVQLDIQRELQWLLHFASFLKKRETISGKAASRDDSKRETQLFQQLYPRLVALQNAASPRAALRTRPSSVSLRSAGSPGPAGPPAAPAGGAAKGVSSTAVGGEGTSDSSKGAEAQAVKEGGAPTNDPSAAPSSRAGAACHPSASTSPTTANRDPGDSKLEAEETFLMYQTAARSWRASAVIRRTRESRQKAGKPRREDAGASASAPRASQTSKDEQGVGAGDLGSEELTQQDREEASEVGASRRKQAGDVGTADATGPSHVPARARAEGQVRLAVKTSSWIARLAAIKRQSPDGEGLSLRRVTEMLDSERRRVRGESQEAERSEGGDRAAGKAGGSTALVGGADEGNRGEARRLTSKNADEDPRSTASGRATKNDVFTGAAHFSSAFSAVQSEQTAGDASAALPMRQRNYPVESSPSSSSSCPVASASGNPPRASPFLRGVPAGSATGAGALGRDARQNVHLSARTLSALEAGIKHVPLFSLPTLQAFSKRVSADVLHRRLYGLPPRVPNLSTLLYSPLVERVDASPAPRADRLSSSPVESAASWLCASSPICADSLRRLLPPVSGPFLQAFPPLPRLPHEAAARAHLADVRQARLEYLAQLPCVAQAVAGDPTRAPAAGLAAVVGPSATATVSGSPSHASSGALWSVTPADASFTNSTLAPLGRAGSNRQMSPAGLLAQSALRGSAVFCAGAPAVSPPVATGAHATKAAGAKRYASLSSPAGAARPAGLHPGDGQEAHERAAALKPRVAGASDSTPSAPEEGANVPAGDASAGPVGVSSAPVEASSVETWPDIETLPEVAAQILSTYVFKWNVQALERRVFPGAVAPFSRGVPCGSLPARWGEGDRCSPRGGDGWAFDAPGGSLQRRDSVGGLPVGTDEQRSFAAGNSTLAASWASRDAEGPPAAASHQQVRWQEDMGARTWLPRPFSAGHMIRAVCSFCLAEALPSCADVLLAQGAVTAGVQNPLPEVEGILLYYHERYGALRSVLKLLLDFGDYARAFQLLLDAPSSGGVSSVRLSRRVSPSGVVPVPAPLPPQKASASGPAAAGARALPVAAQSARKAPAKRGATVLARALPAAAAASASAAAEGAGGLSRVAILKSFCDRVFGALATPSLAPAGLGRSASPTGPFGAVAAASMLIESFVAHSVALQRLPDVLRSLARAGKGSRGEAFIEAVKLCLRKRRALQTLYAMHTMTHDFLNAGILAVILSLAASARVSPSPVSAPGERPRDFRAVSTPAVPRLASRTASGSSAERSRSRTAEGTGPAPQGFADKSLAVFDAASAAGPPRCWDQQMGYLQEGVRLLGGVLAEVKKRDRSHGPSSLSKEAGSLPATQRHSANPFGGRPSASASSVASHRSLQSPSPSGSSRSSRSSSPFAPSVASAASSSALAEGAAPLLAVEARVEGADAVAGSVPSADPAGRKALVSASEERDLSPSLSSEEKKEMARDNALDGGKHPGGERDFQWGRPDARDSECRKTICGDEVGDGRDGSAAAPLHGVCEGSGDQDKSRSSQGKEGAAGGDVQGRLSAGLKEASDVSTSEDASLSRSPGDREGVATSAAEKDSETDGRKKEGEDSSKEAKKAAEAAPSGAPASQCELLDLGDQRDISMDEVDAESLATLLELLTLQLECLEAFPSLPPSLSLLTPQQEHRVRLCACLLFYGKFNWALKALRLCKLNRVEVFLQAATLIASKTNKIQRTHEFLTKVTAYLSAEDMDMLASSAVNVWAVEHSADPSQCQQAMYLIPFLSSPYRRFEAHLLLSSLASYAPNLAGADGSTLASASSVFCSGEHPDGSDALSPPPPVGGGGDRAHAGAAGLLHGEGAAAGVPSSFSSTASASAFACQQLQQCMQLAARLASPQLLQASLEAAQGQGHSQLVQQIQTLMRQQEKRAKRRAE